MSFVASHPLHVDKSKIRTSSYPNKTEKVVKSKIQLVAREIAAIPLSDVRPLPKAELLDPLLGRMSVSALGEIFENELAHCLRAMETFSKLDTNEPSYNSRRRLLLNQFRKCWDQYGAHLPKGFVDNRLIEAGEALLHIEGFHDIAKMYCFAKYMREARLRSEKNRVQRSMKVAERGDFLDQEAQDQNTSFMDALSSNEVSLLHRCQFGMALCEFLSMLSVDVTLQTPPVRSRILKVLESITHVSEECTNYPEHEWLVMEGCKHVMTIIDYLWASNKDWNDVLPFVEEALSNILKCSSLCKPKHVPWVSKLYCLIFHRLVKTSEVKKLNEHLSSFSKITSLMIGGGPEKDSEAFKKINELIFLANVQEIGAGNLLRVDPSKSKEVEAEDEALNQEKRVAFHLVPPTRVNKVTHFASLAMDMEMQGRSSVLIPRRKKPALKVEQKVKVESNEQNLLHPASILRRLSSTHRSATMPKFKMNLPDLSFENQSVAKEQTVLESDISPESAPDVYAPIPASLADTSIKTKKQLAAKSKKPKGSVPVTETEVHKSRRLVITELVEMLRVFQSDDEKLHVLTESLSFLSDVTSTNDLSICHKPNEKLSSTHGMLYDLLLDTAFELVVSEEESLLQKGGLLSILIGESPDPSGNYFINNKQIGSLPNLHDVSRLIQRQSLRRFKCQDVMMLCRFLFRAFQWERFVVVAQVLEHLLTEGTTSNVSSLEASKAARELTLRAAFINFYNILHAERKVMFNFDLASMSGTMEDMRGKRLHIAFAFHDASVALLNSLSECLDIPALMDSSPRLFLDPARLLWSFVDPYVKDYLKLNIEILRTEISKDDIVLRVLKCIHVITSQFPNEEVEFAISASLKLSYLLERLNQPDEAIRILNETSAKITECRTEYGDGSGNLWMLANHAGIMVQYLINNNPMTPMKLKLPVFEIETFQSMIRCDIKRQYEEAFQFERRKREEYERLNRKRILPQILKSVPTDDYVKFMCGDNLVARAILLMVYASAGVNLTILEKRAMLLNAASCLRKQKVIEKSHINDIMKKMNDNVTQLSMRCPAPSIIRRTPTSVTISPNHMISDTGHLLVPTSYQAFCIEYIKGGRVALNDMSFPGTGEMVTVAEKTEITVYGLEPNRRYIFAVAAYDESGQILGRGISESTKGITTSYSLPLSLCWAELSQISHDLMCDDIASEGYDYVWNHFVKSICPTTDLCIAPSIGNTGVTHASTFQLHEENLQFASIELSTRFVECVHQKLDRSFAVIDPSVHSNMLGTRDTLQGQKLRFQSSQELLVAVEVSKRIQNFSLLLRSGVKLATCLLPFSEFSIDTPFVTHALLIAHGCILQCETEKVSLESEEILGLFKPLLTSLISRLLSWKEYSAVVRVAEDSIKYINSRAGLFDTSISNSATIEQQWTGLVPRTKRYAMNQKKNIILNIQADNVYQLLVAVSENPQMGYDTNRKRIEILKEGLEFTLCFSTLTIKPPIPYEKRYLDQTSSLKEIYHIFAACGIDVTFQELAKYKKNPRYLELVTKCVQWSLSKNVVDQTVKVCYDTFDWLSLRNRFLAFANQVMDEGDNSAKDALIQRRKRSLFHDKKSWALDSIGKSERKSRARNRENKANLNSLVDGGVSRQKQSFYYPTEVESVSPTPTQVETSSRVPSREKGISRSRSPSVENNKAKELSESHASLKGIGRKRKKMAQKNMILSGLSQAEKEKLEKAVRCLDLVLGTYWKQKRYSQRLRTIVATEASWRSQIAKLLSSCLLKKLDQDIGNQEISTLLQQDTIWSALELTTDRPLNPMYEPSPMVYVLPLCVEFQSRAGPPIEGNKKSEPELNKAVSDILQGIVQSIVLASRVKNWLLVLTGCQSLWNTTHAFLRSGYITSGFLRTMLWKPLFIASEYLMELLESTRILVDTNVLERSLSSRVPNFVSPEDELHSKHMSFTCHQDLVEKDYKCCWVNSYNQLTTMKIDLLWCAKNLMFGIESMIIAGACMRSVPVLKKFNTIFKGIYSNWSQSLILECEALAVRGIAITHISCGTNTIPNDIGGQLLHNRHLFNRLVHKKVHAKTKDPQTALSVLMAFTETFEAYEQTLKLCKHLNNSFYDAIVCNEYGDLWHANENLKEASFFWSKSFEYLIGHENATEWSKLSHHSTILNNVTGTKKRALLGVVAFKLGEYGHLCGNDKRVGLFLFCAVVFSSLFSQSVPHPSDPLHYANYTASHIVPNLDLFSDRFILEPLILTEYLQILSSELLANNHPLESLKMASITSYLGAEVLVDDCIYGMSIMQKAHVLMTLGFVQPALEKVLSVSTGYALLQNRNIQPSIELSFRSAETIYSTSNWTVFKQILDLEMSTVSLRVYGAGFARAFLMYRVKLLIQLMKISHANDPASANPIYCNVMKSRAIRETMGQPAFISARKADNIDLTFITSGPSNSSTLISAEVTRSRRGSSFSVFNQSAEAIKPAKQCSVEWKTAFTYTCKRIKEILQSTLSDCESALLREGTTPRTSKKSLLYLMEAHDMIAEIEFLSMQYDVAVKRLLDAQAKGLETSKKFRMILNSSHWLHLRVRMVEYLSCAGLFVQAKKMAEIGIKEALGSQARTSELKLRSLLILSDANTVITNSDIGQSWSQGLIQLQKMMSQETKNVFVSNWVLADTWKCIGDTLSLAAPDRQEAIAMAYDQAEEYLIKFLRPKHGSIIPFSAYSPYFATLAIVLYQRVLHYQQASNMTEAYKLVTETIDLAEKVKGALPHSLCSLMTLTHGHILYRHYQHDFSRSQTQDRDETKRLFANVILGEVSMGGSDCRILRSAFEGLLAVSIEEGNEFLARRIAHCLSLVSEVQTMGALRSYAEIFGVNTVASPLQGLDDNEAIVRLLHIHKHLFDLTLGVIWKNETVATGLLDMAFKVADALNFRHDRVFSLNRLTHYTADPYHAEIDIQLRILNAVLPLTVVSKLCFSSTMLPFIQSLSDLDLSSASPELLSFLSTTKAQTAAIVQKACIQWLNMPVRLTDGEGEAINDRLWNLVICFATSSADSDAGLVGRRNSHSTLVRGNKSSASNRMSSRVASSAGVRRESNSVRPMSGVLSRRASTAIVLISSELSEGAASNVSPVYTTKVHESAVVNVMDRSHSAAVAFWKYKVSRDGEMLKRAEADFQHCLEAIVEAVSRHTVPDILIFGQPPTLSEQMLQSIQNFFSLTKGHTSQTPDDAFLFQWLQHVSSFS
ncbi:hypothetical protein BC830DRAFT_1224679 [Chytriomyces sp. MP71]|nr:hypothetical protein BC830DRAFT_1224679 [Chytriomyces sp. MP71]